MSLQSGRKQGSSVIHVIMKEASECSEVGFSLSWSCEAYSKLRTQSQVGGHTAEDEGGEKGKRDDEHVEEAVVALSHAISHPGAMMVKPLWRKGNHMGLFILRN